MLLNSIKSGILKGACRIDPTDTKVEKNFKVFNIIKGKFKESTNGSVFCKVQERTPDVYMCVHFLGHGSLLIVIFYQVSDFLLFGQMNNKTYEKVYSSLSSLTDVVNKLGNFFMCCSFMTD